MEIKYKYLLIISIISSILILITFNKRKKLLNNSILIANTEYIENTNYYQKKLHIYKLLKFLIIILYIISFISSYLLIGRLSIKNTNNYSNDIYFCLDVSSNLDELNLQIMNNLLKSNKIYHNTNYGISIFNASSAIISPLTHDYKYIKYQFKMIIKSIKVNNPSIYGEYNKPDYLLLKNYIVSGTTYDYQTKGTSLIGDGLTSCINNINKRKNNNKILILTTDNKTSGIETTSIIEAYKIAKKEKIKIISITPENINNKNKKELTYISDKVFSLKSNKKLIKYLDKNIISNKSSEDIPFIPFIILYVSINLIIILKKVII